MVITHSFENSLLRLNQNQIIYTQNRVDRMILILVKFCRSQGSLPFVLWGRDGRVTLGTRKMRAYHRWNGLGMPIERFSYDLEMETCEKKKQKEQTDGNRAIWLVYRMDPNAQVKNFMPENFLEINWYFALTSQCNTIGQSNNAFSILGFSLAGKRRGHVLIFSSIGW